MHLDFLLKNAHGHAHAYTQLTPETAATYGYAKSATMASVY